MSKRIQGQVKAYITSEWDVRDYLITGEIEVSGLMYSNTDMEGCGWVKVGEASIEVDLLTSQEDLKAQQIKTLRAEIQKTKADAQVKVNGLEEKVRNLEALEWNGEGEVDEGDEGICVKTGCDVLWDDIIYHGDLFLKQGCWFLYGVPSGSPRPYTEGEKFDCKADTVEFLQVKHGYGEYALYEVHPTAEFAIVAKNWNPFEYQYFSETLA